MSNLKASCGANLGPVKADPNRDDNGPDLDDSSARFRLHEAGCGKCQALDRLTKRRGAAIERPMHFARALDAMAEAQRELDRADPALARRLAALRQATEAKAKKADAFANAVRYGRRLQR